VTASSPQPTPSGIGGWLLLVTVGVCLAPPATWHARTTLGTRAYHPLFWPLIVGELAVNAALLIWAGALVSLFITQGWAFPVAMIAFLIGRVVVQAAGRRAHDPGGRGPHGTGRLRWARHGSPGYPDLGAVPDHIPPRGGDIRPLTSG